MPVELKGKSIQNSDKASIAVWGRDMCNKEKPRKETGGEWDENAAMDVWSDEGNEHVRG